MKENLNIKQPGWLAAFGKICVVLLVAFALASCSQETPIPFVEPTEFIPPTTMPPPTSP